MRQLDRCLSLILRDAFKKKKIVIGRDELSPRYDHVTSDTEEDFISPTADIATRCESWAQASGYHSQASCLCGQPALASKLKFHLRYVHTT